jgi:hypothetical protein
MREARIQIADITLGVYSAAPSLDIELDGDMELFSTPEAGPDLFVEARWRNLNNGCKGRKVFDSGGAWQLYLNDNAYWFHCTAPAFGGIPYKIARFERDFSCGEVFLHRPFFKARQGLYPLQYPLDELLILSLLSQGKGVEVHACGIVDVTGEGCLFVGPSGAGKTTLARLWGQQRGVAILSDDRIILRRDEKQIWMYGTPWHGEAELAAASKAPLKAIYFIRHGRKNFLKSRSGAEAVAQLFTCSFPVFYSREGLEFTLDFYGGIARDVPCSELNVVPTREVIDFIRGNN